MSDVEGITVVIEWNGQEYQIDNLIEQNTVATLKYEIFKKTQVRPDRQKLLNLKYNNKLATDELQLSQLELKPNFKIIMMDPTEPDFTVIVKWNGQEFPINNLVDEDTVGSLKDEIFEKTQVRPDRQKLLNLKYDNKLATNEILLSQLTLKPDFKIMMMGSTEEDILKTARPKFVTVIVKWNGQRFLINNLIERDTVATLKREICKKTQVSPEKQNLLNLKYNNKLVTDDIQLIKLKLKPNFKIIMITDNDCFEDGIRSEDVTNFIDNFDYDKEKYSSTFANNPIYLNKVQKLIRDYDIEEINPPRENKKLLVLDIEYTIFDHKSKGATGELMRPYLHEFLASAYQNYDIVLWSIYDMAWIKNKINSFGVNRNPNYKIAFYLDTNAIITIDLVDIVIDMKPLSLIWGKYSDYYSSENTIIIDDTRRSFFMNIKSGLKIRAYREAYLNRYKDTELLKLKKYLLNIADCDDFNELQHRKWETYDPRKL